MKEWDTGISVINHCPYMYTNKKLLIRYHIYHLATLLSREFVGNEWLFYADYTETEDYIIIENPEIPEQEVTSASVNVKKPLNKNVVIHKHPYGVSGFSSIDETYINANNVISILYEGGKFVKAKIRKKLPCGHYGSIEIPIAGIIVVDSIEAEKEIARKIFVEQKNRIKEKVIKVYYPYRYYIIDSNETKKKNRKDVEIHWYEWYDYW